MLRRLNTQYAVGVLGVGDMSFQLPKQEYRLMEQLMLNHTRYLSTEELLIKAWGEYRNGYLQCLAVYILFA